MITHNNKQGLLLASLLLTSLACSSNLSSGSSYAVSAAPGNDGAVSSSCTQNSDCTSSQCNHSVCVTACSQNSDCPAGLAGTTSICYNGGCLNFGAKQGNASWSGASSACVAPSRLPTKNELSGSCSNLGTGMFWSSTCFDPNTGDSSESPPSCSNEAYWEGCGADAGEGHISPSFNPGYISYYCVQGI